MAGIRRQIEGDLSAHLCRTIRGVSVVRSIVATQIDVRADGLRAAGTERVVQSYVADVPLDKITFLAALDDLTDPQTALRAAIRAGTQPAGTPIPNPATPCAGGQ